MAKGSLALGLLLASLLAARPVAATPAAAESPELAPALGHLDRAFKASDADALRPLLSPGRKVLLAVPCVLDEDAFLGADQVYYRFHAFFARHRTTAFQLAKASVEGSGRLATVRGEWRFKSERGETRLVPLAFTLAADEDGWVVTEIRALRS